MESLPNEIVERILRSDEVSFHDLVAFSSTCSRCISFVGCSQRTFLHCCDRFKVAAANNDLWRCKLCQRFTSLYGKVMAQVWQCLALTSLFRLEGGALLQVAWTGARS